MPMGPASERFDVQIVVIDNMPNTIDVRVLCFYPVTQSLTPSVVTNLMEFAARANYALPVGHFDLSRDAGGKPVVFVGTTRFTAAASLEHLPLLAARLMHTCFAVTSKYYSAVMGILRGSRDSVERLVAVCEGDTSGASGCGVGGSTAVPAGVAEVKAALDMKGWTARSIEHVSTHGATKIWKVAMSKGTGAKKFEVEIEVRDTMPDTIYVSVKSTFPETSRSTTVIANFTEFVTRANFGIQVGRFDVNLSTLMGSGAKVEYFTSVMFSAASLGHLRHLVVELFDRNFHTLDRYWEGLMKVFRNGDRDDLRVAAIVDECEGRSVSGSDFGATELLSLLQGLGAAPGGSGGRKQSRHHVHALEPSVPPRKCSMSVTCDVCRGGRGSCEYTCSAGCDWDMCRSCFQAEFRDSRGSGGSSVTASSDTGSSTQPIDALLKALLEQARETIPVPSGGPRGGRTRTGRKRRRYWVRDRGRLRLCDCFCIALTPLTSAISKFSKLCDIPFCRGKLLDGLSLLQSPESSPDPGFPI